MSNTTLYVEYMKTVKTAPAASNVMLWLVGVGVLVLIVLL